MDEAGALTQLLAIVGGSSPAMALLAWHMWNQSKQFDRFGARQEESTKEFTEAIHDVDKRLAVIESFVENVTRVTAK